MKESCFKGCFCSKEGFNKDCHSQFCRAQHLGIFRILSSYVKKGDTLCDNDTYVEDPRLQASGMTPNWIATRAFTLIELLVVVLIIGILAAVAVPQYQKAVEKSRAMEAISIISSVAKAIDVWILENGYPNNVVQFIGQGSDVSQGELLINIENCTPGEECVSKFFEYSAACVDNGGCNISAETQRYWLEMSRRPSDGGWEKKCWATKSDHTAPCCSTAMDDDTGTVMEGC